MASTNLTKAQLKEYNERLKGRNMYLESLKAEPEDIEAIADDYRKHCYINGEPTRSWTVEVISRQYKTVKGLQEIACCDHNGIVTAALREAERQELEVWPREKELAELNKWLKSLIGDCG